MAEVVIPHNSDNAPRPSPFVLHDSNDSSQSLNPDFMFPAPSATQDASHPHRRTPSHMAFLSQSTGHKRKPSNLSLSMIPPFEFGLPSQNSPSKPFPSPTRSPARLTPPSHAAGHKRSGSEFVGGDITHGGPVLVNRSSSEETAAPTPPSPAKSLSAGRRGHSHRRSHAISQHDLSGIMQPTKEDDNRSGRSTPATGSKPESRPPPPQRSKSQPEKPPTCHPDSSAPSVAANLSQSWTRARVGFSENLEFIPRPLSTISSETSSSMSTVRANHSVSGSVSSLVSGGASSPPSRSTASAQTTPSASLVVQTPENALPEEEDRRHASKPESEENQMLTPDISQEASMQVVDASLLGDVQTVDNTDVNPFVFPATLQDSNSQDAFEAPTSGPSAPLRSVSPSRPKTSPESKSSGKQHRVKSWAGMLRPRKDKLNPFPEPHVSSTMEIKDERSRTPEFTLDDMTFDDDTTTIIEEPLPPNAVHAKPHKALSYRQRIPLPSSPDVTQSTPVLDLDAALLPLSPTNPEDSSEYFGKLTGGKRRLHSNEKTAGFTGPGMHYHRRTESAPELPPPERSRFGMQRFGSNPAMDEAIAEEDEGDEDAKPGSNCSEDQAMGLGVNIVEAEQVSEGSILRPSARSAHGDPPRVIRRIVTPPDAINLLDPVQIADSEEEPRFSMITKSSDDSSITPTVSPDPFLAHHNAAPLDSALQTPSLTHGTTPETPSAVSSADYRQTSFDMREPRLHTARSSMTDRVTLSSSKAGDFSAGSVDDVPSLTSSSSTMMSGLPSQYPIPGSIAHPGERSASLSAAVPSHRHRPGSSSKRASLASLSKLMVGPYSRSKLNIEETLPADSPEKPDKKRHRISRMMKFWKSKEKLALA